MRPCAARTRPFRLKHTKRIAGRCASPRPFQLRCSALQKIPRKVLQLPLSIITMIIDHNLKMFTIIKQFRFIWSNASKYLVFRNGTELTEYGRGLYSSDMEATRAEEVIR
jgi:hypothetical protein